MLEQLAEDDDVEALLLERKRIGRICTDRLDPERACLFERLTVDVDGSVWAIWVPGHTVGSTAFIARTAEGPVLLVGDTSHTSWGWLNGVEPGSFTADHAANAVALEKLRALAAEHPAMSVRLGHQRLEQPANRAAK